jgi:hypothetical protein
MVRCSQVVHDAIAADPVRWSTETRNKRLVKHLECGGGEDELVVESAECVHCSRSDSACTLSRVPQ